MLTAMQVPARVQDFTKKTSALNDARASLRAAFSRIDTLTIASVLPGIGGHYLVPRTAMECGTSQLNIDYVRSSLSVLTTDGDRSAPVYGVSLELDFHESKLKVIGVDHIVGDAGEAGIRSARLQGSLSHA